MINRLKLGNNNLEYLPTYALSNFELLIVNLNFKYYYNIRMVCMLLLVICILGWYLLYIAAHSG